MKQLRNVSICLDPWYFATFYFAAMLYTDLIVFAKIFCEARYADARLRATTRPLGCSLFKSFMLVHAGDIDMWQSVYLGSANWFYTL